MYSIFVTVLWLFISQPALEVDYYADLSSYASLSEMPFEDSRYFREKKGVVFDYYGDLCVA